MVHFTSAMLFPPVHGGCYIISSVGNGYSCGVSVICDVFCLYVIKSCDLSVLAMPLMGFQKKKYLDRGVGGWVELYPNYFWIFGIFLTLQSPLETIHFVLPERSRCH